MIKIHYCGCDSRHSQAFDFQIPYGHGEYVLLMVKTDAFFELDKGLTDTRPNTVILYEKGAKVHYGASAPGFNDDWIHFDLTSPDTDFLYELKLPLNTPFPLSDMGVLTELSRRICAYSHMDAPYREEILDSLMKTLLYSIASQRQTAASIHSKNRHYQPMSSLREEILNSPNEKWNVPELADKVHLSTSHFQALYKTFFGVTCKEEIISARIEQARYFLRTTEMSIHALSNHLGYESELHFMRQFKKYTGLTPSQYRNTQHSI